MLHNHEAAPSILVLNGPNLNLIGRRRTDMYGSLTLPQIHDECQRYAQSLGLGLAWRQTNHEGELLDWLHEADGSALGVVINPGAFGRTSLAIHTAVELMTTPVIEVHLSNIAAKASYLPPSYLSRQASGTIFGFGWDGYILAIHAIHRRVSANAPSAS